ncbi:MAG: anhydro-N-acetylmuramic acid kinase [Planctomycetota bacterium]|nr:MAG: anhydro-N-acetylmuramic acid kinase [Planctomycetota bacterium]
MGFALDLDRPRLLLGIGSGTSADAIDLALVEVHGRGGGRRVRILTGDERPYPEDLAARVRTAVELDPAGLASLHVDLGRAFAAAAAGFLADALPAGAALTAVGSHGQTVFHHGGDPLGGTLQLGDAAWIADAVGAPVVADFRWSDLAAGGQGAPISPFADWVLHRQAAERLAILNLGGIANLTLLAGEEPPLAGDTGPANGPLDALMRLEAGRPCDRDGRLAAAGVVQADLVPILRGRPFFGRPFPRSTGLEAFGEPLVRELRRTAPQTRLEDLLATLVDLAAWAVGDALERLEWPGGPVFLCGGGARNPTLVKALRRYLEPRYEIRDYAALGWDPSLREAVAFALLADAFLAGEPASWPSTTGVRRPARLGRLVPPPCP